MAKKGFSDDNPLNKLAGTSAPKSIEPQEAVEPKPTTPELDLEKTQDMQKRKVGRPKTKDIKNTCKNINVAVPIALLDKWEDIKLVHGSNLTGYITKLIEKDMASNYEHYKDIADSLKNI